MEDKNLIFLMSQPRSGSTLLQKLLGGHSAIYTRSEPWIMLYPAYLFKRGGTHAEYNMDINRIALSTFFEGLPDGESTYKDELKRMCLRLYGYYFDHKKYKYFLDKTPRYYLIEKELRELFPSAKYIFLIRNPLAVLGSICNTRISRRWHVLSKFKVDLIQWLPIATRLLQSSDNLMVVRYEDLLNDKDSTMSKLLSYLQLSEDSNIDSFFDVGNDWLLGDRHNSKTKKTLDKNNIDAWTQGLGDPQYWRVFYDYLNFIGEQNMQLLGYSYKDCMAAIMKNVTEEEKDTIINSTYSLDMFMNDVRDYLAAYASIESECFKLKDENKRLELENKRMEILNKTISKELKKYKKRIINTEYFKKSE